MGKGGKGLIFGLLAVAVILCGVGVAIVMSRQKPVSDTTGGVQGQTYSTRVMKVNNQQYTLQVADTSTKQALGLGGRDNLAPKAGMLFTYAQPADDVCYWMKDMRFSLDIIWLDAHKQITMIEPSLSPATYPHSYCSSTPTQYVVELNAGIANSLGLHQGQKLDFNL
jgi:uncharacterized protein